MYEGKVCMKARCVCRQGVYEDRRHQGRPARTWFDDVKDWTGLNGQVDCHRRENREDWRRLVKIRGHRRSGGLRL